MNNEKRNNFKALQSIQHPRNYQMFNDFIIYCIHLLQITREKNIFAPLPKTSKPQKSTLLIIEEKKKKKK